MILSDFIVLIQEQFDDADLQLSATSNFRDIDAYDSIVALSIIAVLDDEYNVSITGDDLKSAPTISELFALVQSKMGE